MHPLNAILVWWESLKDGPRFFVATEICCRLTGEANIMERHEELLRQLLQGQLAVERHVGRTLAVRAVVDFFFIRTDLDDLVQRHLETVETNAGVLKSTANAAIGRISRDRPEWDRARDTWRVLREGQLADASLASWEQACRGASILKQLR